MRRALLHLAALVVVVVTPWIASAQTITNPGYESQSTGWTHGGPTGVETANPRTGSYNMYDNGSWGNIYQNVSGFTTNTSYTLAVWVKLSSSSGVNHFRMYHSLNGGTTKTYTNVGSASVGAYAQVTTTFNTGAATTVQIGLEHDGTSSTGSAYIDDWTISSGGGSLPSGWTAIDIGSPSPAGSTTHSSGTWTVKGGGADIWNASDQFHYAYKDASGDTTVIARVDSLTNTDGWAKAGVMIRDGTAANARFAMVVVTASNGVAFQRRTTTGGSCTNNNVTGVTAPRWVRLVRSGNNFTASYSGNGTSWTNIGSAVSISMPTATKAGLCVTSHNNGTLCTATMSNVSVTAGGGGSPPPTPTGLTAAAGNGQVALSWSASSGATSYNVKRSTTSGSGHTTVASPTTTSYTNTGLTNGTTYYYVVSAVNSAGQSANSSQVSATPSGNPASLFANAGFENDLASWTNTGNSVITTDAASGTKAVRTGTGSGGVQQQVSYSSTTPININVKAKVSGTISGWCGIGIDFLNSSGTELGEATFNVTSTTYASWVISGQSIPTGTTSLRFWTWKPGTTGYLFMDDVVVTQGSVSVPPAPTGLTATPGNGQVTLSWNTSSGATSYNVKRSTTSGSGYGTIASPTTTSYTNTGLTNGTTYYYVVSAVSSAGQSANSSQVSATPMGSTNKYELGIGVGAPLDYEPDVIYADLIRVARQMDNVVGTVDPATGWVTSGTANIMVCDGAPNYGGTYALQYDGQAAVTLSQAPSGSTISAATYNSGTNTSTRTITIPNQGSSATRLVLGFTSTTAGVRNVKLMRPITYGSSTPHGFNELFARDLKNIHARFQWIRFMDFLATNGSGTVTWADRTRPNRWSYNWTKAGYWWQGVGGPFEHTVQYCNEIGKDLWVCVPHKANDDFMLKLAQLIRYGADANGNPYTSGNWNDAAKVYKGLDPNLKVYVEFSNEIWNSGFPQFGQTRDLALAEVAAGNTNLNYDGTTDEITLMSRFWMKRTVQMSTTFRSVFGDAAMMSRVRPLYQAQSWIDPWIGRGFRFLDSWYNNGDGVAHVATPRPINYYIWGGGNSGYVHQQGFDPSTMTLDSIYNEVYPAQYAPWRDEQRLVINWMRVWGLKRVVYEASPTFESNYPSEPLRGQIQQDPRQKQVYKNFVRYFVEDGGDMYTNFLTINSTHGIAWTLQGDFMNTPRMQAVAELNVETPPVRTYGTALPATIYAGRYLCREDGWSTGSSDSAQDFGADSWLGFVVRNGGTSNATYAIRLNAGSAQAGHQVNVWVDGNLAGTLTVPNTGSTSTYLDTSALNVTLSPGQHGIRLDGVGGSYGSYRVNQLKIQ